MLQTGFPIVEDRRSDALGTVDTILFLDPPCPLGSLSQSPAKKRRFPTLALLLPAVAEAY
jgi:hypothetical protein